MPRQTGLLLAAATILAGGLFAMPALAASASGASSVYPARDMTMAQVRAEFGPPERRLPPDPATSQGPLKPPIVRWIYPRFIVYFERNRVIHTVLTHPREAPPVVTAAGG